MNSAFCSYLFKTLIEIDQINILFVAFFSRKFSLYKMEQEKKINFSSFLNTTKILQGHYTLNNSIVVSLIQAKWKLPPYMANIMQNLRM